ncbi:MAG: DegV family protein [Paludibacter sp.]|nr:DegV family protein [Paludibacter sp.]
MEVKSLFQLDGRLLFFAFQAGGNRLLQHQAEINNINVFPVNDKDTGTNLASTVRSVLDTIKPTKSYKETIYLIANNALMGARGNSGIIFSQFLYGISCETPEKATISQAEFAESIKKSIPYIYEAVANPVEGTILTVIKDWSDFLSDKKHNSKSFSEIIVDSLELLNESLNETKLKMKMLQQQNLVDAGAKGFVVFIEGVIDFIRSTNIREFVFQSAMNIPLIHTEDIDYDIQFRFCTEAIIKNVNIGKTELQYFLSDKGDSVVVAGSEKLCRVHVHTNNPAELFFRLKDFGTITFQKADDMIRQNEAVTRRKWNIALVTDSTCDLSQELTDFYQVYSLPLNINFGDNHYLDKVTITPDHFYDLLESSVEPPTTSQINEQSFTNLYSHLASHYDAIISVHLTSQFSGTYLNSVKAAEKIAAEFNKPVYTIDSKTLSGALGLLVLRVAQAIEAGLPIDKIVELVEKCRTDAKIFVSVKDLKYMIKGGRVSKQKGYIANLLGINPIVSMDESGKSILFGQTFSQRANINKVMKQIKKISTGKTIWNYSVLHAHNPSGAQIYADKMLILTGKQPISVVDISPVIGMNAGSGTIAVSLLFD